MRDPSADGDVAQIASDPDAFEAFYRRHVEAVRRFVARSVEGWPFQEGAPLPGDK